MISGNYLSQILRVFLPTFAAKLAKKNIVFILPLIDQWDLKYKDLPLISLLRYTFIKCKYFVLSFFPRDVLGDIWELLESVSEGFPTYFCSKTCEEKHCFYFTIDRAMGPKIQGFTLNSFTQIYLY